MNFDELPDGPCDNHPRDVCVRGLPAFLWSPQWAFCMVCGQPTTWIELAFEGSLCPGVCAYLMWRDYLAAEAAAGPWERPDGV